MSKNANALKAKEEQAHAAKLQRQILDWTTVVRPRPGDVLVMRVPDELFVMPGTKPEDITDEQNATMTACHGVIQDLVSGITSVGIQLGGAAILAESMSLEDLPPPWAKPEPSIPVARSKLILPPGTKI